LKHSERETFSHLLETYLRKESGPPIEN